MIATHSGAVHLQSASGFRRVAATGTGLTLPLETDQLQRAALSVHRRGPCALMRDWMDPASDELLDDATSEAGRLQSNPDASKAS